MKVLLAASEAHPFIKTGGLGDVIGALPKSLINMEVDARIIIPKYKNIKEELKDKLEFIKDFVVKVGWRNQHCGLFKAIENGVTYYFIDNEYYFNRDELYGYYDDGERFAFFDRAILQAIKELDWKPDVIHCNDWQTGMIPVLLKLEFMGDEFYQNIKTVFSIHNMLFQGIFDTEVLPELFGYDMEAFNNGSLEFNGCVSYMKGGINYCDKISTVSYSYAEEIKTPEFGEDLDGLLRERGYAVQGIINGIDYEEYNPSKDLYIFKKFGKNYLTDKNKNKKELQSELGLPVSTRTPVIGIVSRLTSQKGLDLIAHVADRLLERDVQLVVLGTGDEKYQNDFNYFKWKYPDKVSVNIKFDNTLAHKIYAGSDMFLMPSLFEPCGLGQLIALRYGTIPIVRETGGLRDTITPYNQYTGEGNGFSFTNFNGEELFMIIEYALDIFKNKKVWKSIVKEAIESDNSWEKSAKEYINLYTSLSI